MKKCNIVIGIVLLTLLGGCTKETIETGTRLHKVTLHARTGSSTTTRAGFESDGTFFWSETDRIGITTTSPERSFQAVRLISGVGETDAVFEGMIEGEMTGYAVYPYNSGHAIRENRLSYRFPASYSYARVDTDFFSGKKGEGNSFNPPMWGRTEGNRVLMRHLGGVFCIKAEELPSGESLTLTLTSDKRLNGDYAVDLSADLPVLEAVQARNATEGRIDITFGNTSDRTSGVFYIPAATGIYNDLTVSIRSGDRTLVYKNFGTVTIRRQSLKRLEIRKDEGNPENEWKNRTFWVDGVRNPPLSEWGYAFTDPYRIPGLEWKREYGWYDCNKTFVISPGAGDDNLCWAATASNLIYWWLDRNRKYLDLYGKYTGPQTYGNSMDCDVFQFFKDNFINEGNWINDGLDWFFKGKKPGYGLKANSSHGGFLPEVLKGDILRYGSGYTLTEDLKKAFRDGEAIGLIIDVKAGRARHAITVWGADFDEKGEVCALYIVENNDLEMELDPYIPSPMQPGKLCHIGLYPKKVRKDKQGYYWMESAVKDRYTIGIYQVNYLGTHEKEWKDYLERQSPTIPLPASNLLPPPFLSSPQ